MPPKFKTESFDFTEDETIPDHIEGNPSLNDKDPTKYSVEGYDPFDYTSYGIAIDIDDLATTQLLSSARIRQIERTQLAEGYDIVSPR